MVDRPGSDRLIDERDAAIEGASHMRAKQALDVFPTRLHRTRRTNMTNGQVKMAPMGSVTLS